MLSVARFKPARQTTRVKHRILCGKVDARGYQSCRGELGHLIMKIQGGRYLFLHPLMSGTMARDSQGWYRMARQRRPYLSGSEGGRHVGGGVSRAADANVLRDAQGVPLKWLEPIYDHPSHDRLVVACPRCQTPNEVIYGDFMAYFERTYAQA